MCRRPTPGYCTHPQSFFGSLRRAPTLFARTAGALLVRPTRPVVLLQFARRFRAVMPKKSRGLSSKSRAMLARMASPNRWLLLAASSAVVSGCGGRSNLDGESSYLDYGGSTSDAGGSLNTGGTFGVDTSTGGYNNLTGGARASGGAGGTGGAKVRPTGGNPSTGGSRAATGGIKSTGGTSAFFPTGGTKSTGGKSAFGGSGATGGSFAAGGTATTGGGKATGGTAGVGGIKATGGSSGFGGTQFTGGAPGTTGGTTGTGGSGGTGGSKATGGVPPTGGAPPTGGYPGTGGSSACPTYLLANEELIDDMNDGNAAIPEVNLRRGAWSDLLVNTSGASIYPDPSTPFVVTDTGDICRKFAVFVKGQTSIDPGSGANFGFSLGAPYDASAYSGLSFWARIEAGTDPPLRVTFPDGDTDPRGAICSTSTADTTKTCWDHYGLRLTLTTTWTKYSIPFSALSQDSWGYLAQKFDPSTLYSVVFTIGDTATFAIWIDSVAFTK